MTQMCDLISTKGRIIQNLLVVDLAFYGCIIIKWPQMANMK
jgi:hypothetical protein